MGIRNLLSNALSSGVKALTDIGAKAITGPAKDISGTAKDVTGIRKDLAQTKLAQVKVKEHESLIQKATLEDVKDYDDKTRRVVKAATSSLNHDYRTYRIHLWDFSRPVTFWGIPWGFVVACCYFLCYFLWGPTQGFFKWVGIVVGCLVFIGCLSISWVVWDVMRERRRERRRGH